MSTNDEVIPQEQGPISYENWRAASSGIPWVEAVEYPLFSDAHIVGGLTDEYGPYRLTNAIAHEEMRKTRPALVLSVASHLRFEQPDMKKADNARYHGGFLQDEITAIVSLCLGIRLKAGSENRRFGVNSDPRGIPVSFGHYQDPVLPVISRRAVIPGLLATHNMADAAILAGFSQLLPEDANTLVRAARLYQDALWIVETTPELSWLMLTSALETAANRWRSAKESPLERLRASKPNLETLLKSRGDEEFVSQVAAEIAPFLGAAKKFRDFILAFLPDPPSTRPPKAFQHPWSRSKIRDSIEKIYTYRSLALHDGRPFPAPMCEPPHSVGDGREWEEIPAGLATMMRGSTWLREDIPMHLHVFEYIVRHTLLKWWRSLSPRSESSETSRTIVDNERDQEY